MSDFCHISDAQCEAPAGYGISGRGWASGDVKTRIKCWSCGQHVCKKCSKLVMSPRRVRMCNDCIEGRARTEEPVT